MAWIAGAAGNDAAGSGNVSTCPITVPTSGPGGDVAAGMWAVATFITNSGVAGLTLPAGGGWTLIAGPNRVTTANLSAWQCKKQLASGDVGATFTWGVSSASRFSGYVDVLDQVDAVGTPVVSVVSTGSGSVTDPMITTTVDNSMVYVAYQARDASTTAPAITPPGGYTARTRVASNGGTANWTGQGATYPTTGHGSYGGGSASVSPASTGVVVYATEMTPAAESHSGSLTATDLALAAASTNRKAATGSVSAPSALTAALTAGKAAAAGLGAALALAAQASASGDHASGPEATALSLSATLSASDAFSGELTAPLDLAALFAAGISRAGHLNAATVTLTAGFEGGSERASTLTAPLVLTAQTIAAKAAPGSLQAVAVSLAAVLTGTDVAPRDITLTVGRAQRAWTTGQSRGTALTVGPATTTPFAAGHTSDRFSAGRPTLDWTTP